MDTNEIIDELTLDLDSALTRLRELFEHAPTDAAGLIAEVAGPVAAARDALDALDALIAQLAQAQAQ